MPWLIGIDEAGLAPNLGELVITVTVWKCAKLMDCEQIWGLFDEIVSRQADKSGARLHIADSKQVYHSGQGLDRLEWGVLSALSTINLAWSDLPTLWSSLGRRSLKKFIRDPWFREISPDMQLPIAATESAIASAAKSWSQSMRSVGLELHDIRCEIVSPTRLNELLQSYSSKGEVLSTLVFQLLRTVWDPHSDEEVWIFGDKHGGRNRYDGFLEQIVGDEFILRDHESTPFSRYRVRKSQLTFQVGGEEHLPVALASMVSKYVREVLLIPFNQFWIDRVPGLKETKGYPVDAARFRREIAEAQQREGIPDAQLWRAR